MRWAAALTALLLQLAPVGANAECKSASSTFHPSGGQVPPEPVVYFFGAWRESCDLLDAETDAGKPLRLTSIEQPGPGRYVVCRVEVEAPDGVSFRIRHRRGPMSSLYQATRYWEARKAEVEVRGTQLRCFDTDCSWEATQNLHLHSTAPVSRLEWAQSLDTLLAGRGTTAILPSTPTSLHDGESAQGRLIRLGEVACGGTTFHWGGSPVYMDVWALFPDGYELLLTLQPLMLEPPPGCCFRRACTILPGFRASGTTPAEP